MSTINLTPQQQRQMQKLAEHVDEITQGDRRYFEQHPDRKHRVRQTGLAEIAQREILQGIQFVPPPGRRAYTIVRNVSEGVRMRIFIFGPEYAETGVDEDMAEALFDTYASPQEWELEAALRKFAEGRR